MPTLMLPSDNILKQRLRQATRSPKIPHTHSVRAQLPLTYDQRIPQHTNVAIFGLGDGAGTPIPEGQHEADLRLARLTTPIPRLPNRHLHNAKPWQTKSIHAPQARKMAPAPGAFFPGMGDLGAYGVVRSINPPPGTRWMEKHGFRHGQVDGLGAFSALKLKARPPRVLGVPRARKMPLPHSGHFIPGLGEEDAGDTLEAGYLTAHSLAADQSPTASPDPMAATKAVSAATTATRNLMLMTAAAFALGFWLKSR